MRRAVLERIFNRMIEAWQLQDEEREKEIHHPTRFDRAYRAHRNNQACRNRNVRFEGINPRGCHMYYTRSKHFYEYDLSIVFSEECSCFLGHRGLNMELGMLLAIVSLLVLGKGQCYAHLRITVPECITILILIGHVRIASLVTFPNRTKLIHR